MIEKMLLTSVAIVVGTLPALAQEPQPQTVRYDYEWIHVRPADEGPTFGPFTGSLLMSDISSSTPGIGSQSELEGYIRNANSGEILLDCNLNIGRPESHDIVQVGPFAQEAHGDAAALIEDPFATTGQGSNCIVAPAELTIDCPFAGVPVTAAPGHHSFENKGTYHEGLGPLNTPMPAKNTFSQRGEHGPIRCTLNINGQELAMQGTLTRIRETRFGTFVPSEPFWQEPHNWVKVPEDLERFDIRCAPAQECRVVVP